MQYLSYPNLIGSTITSLIQFKQFIYTRTSNGLLVISSDPYTIIKCLKVASEFHIFTFIIVTEKYIYYVNDASVFVLDRLTYVIVETIVPDNALKFFKFLCILHSELEINNPIFLFVTIKMPFT